MWKNKSGLLPAVQVQLYQNRTVLCDRCITTAAHIVCKAGIIASVAAGHFGKKSDVRPDRLLVEREKFAPHIMVLAGVCFGRLHFLHE